MRLTSPSPGNVWRMASLAEEQMGDKQLRTVILRLVLDRWGTLLHGEVVNIEGDVTGRFTRWDQIVTSIKACIAGAKRT
jgi:hypothetical protein